MTDNEIKKALECCSRLGCSNEETADCPLKPCDSCITKLSVNALDLINRQKAEIEKVKQRADEWHREAELIAEKLDGAIAGKEEKENLRCVIEDLSNNTEHARAEAIKEFAERLKLYLHQDDFETPDERWKPESEFATLIDNLVKEMTDKTIEQQTNSDSRQIEINKNAQLVKSFAEMLKYQLSLGLENKIPANVYSFVYCTVDNLVKEMVGEG